MAASETKRITIAEIAKEAGVSAATVSRVINKVDHPIDAKTRKRVEEVIKRKKYTTNVFGKGLAGQPNIIGISVSVPLSSDPGFSQNIARVLDGIKSVASSRNYHVLLEIEETRDKDADTTIFAGVPLAGVLHVAPRENDPVVAALRQGSVPFVLIGNSDFRDCNFVDANNEKAGRMAVRHLVALGRRRLAFFSGQPDFGPSTAMAHGFSAELKEQGLEFRPEWMMSPPMNVEGGRQAAFKVFALSPTSWPSAPCKRSESWASTSQETSPSSATTTSPSRPRSCPN